MGGNMRALLLVFGGLLASQLVTAEVGNIHTASGSLPGEDADFQCIDHDLADKYIRDFNINVRSFGGLELCRNDSESKMLLNDIYLVEEGRFGASRSNLFIRGFIPEDRYYTWMRSETRGVRRGSGIPYATAYNSGGYFTMQDGWSHLSTLGRVGTIIHEARHTAGYGHTPCDQGPYANEYLPGCDSTLSQGGSHGVEMEYYARVNLMGTNFHPIYQQMARLMLLARANFVFNDQPLKPKAAVVARTTSGVLVLPEYAAQPIAHLNLQAAPEWRLKRTSFGAALLSGHEAYALDLEWGKPELVVDAYSYYKILLDGRLGNVLDMEEFDIGDQRYLIALTDSGLHRYIFAEGNWSRPLQGPDVKALLTTTPDGQKGIFVRTTHDEIFALHPETLRRLKKMGDWPSDLSGVAYHGQSILWLLTDGQVVNASSGQKFDPLANEPVVEIITAPVYQVLEDQAYVF